MVQYVLGIDLGTTSVKVCLLNTNTREVAAQHSQDTNSDIPLEQIPEGAHEQDVLKIVAALHSCLANIPSELLKQVIKIGICCQMHGVVLWKNDVQNLAWTVVSNESGIEYDINEKRVSSLFTWQDGRCSKEYLRNLPVPQSHLGISTGFGIPTIFWITQFQPEMLRKYNYAGTIGSFIVAMICNLEVPSISYHNAASWGYFNCRTKEWNLDLLRDAKFPIHLLPDIRSSEDVAGRLSGNWCSIPKGTPVGVDLGDLQCSVLSTFETDQDAVVNISTSAQVSFVVNNYEPSEGPPQVGTVTNWPYFHQQYVSVAASLNGGNILVGFVNMLEQWTQVLGFTVDRSKMWEILLNMGKEDDAASDLCIKPTCFGERFDPDLRGSITNINLLNTGLAQTFRALCRGLIENLHNLLPASTLYKAKVSRIVGCGSALNKNEILQQELQKIYKLPLVLNNTGDAAKGAALAILFKSNEHCCCMKRLF